MRFGRRRSPAEAPAPSPDAVLAGIRQSIVRLDDQRRRAAEAAGRVLVNRVEVERACEEQLATLHAAAAEAEGGEGAARRAAAQARRDADPDVVAFERTAAGLADVRQALAVAAEPVHRLRAEAHDNVTQANEVLTRTRTTLDEQIRAQVRLLRAWEAAEQRRIVRRFRDSPWAADRRAR